MTAEEYTAGVDWVERVDPGNVMLRSLSGQHTQINEIYLTAILKKIGNPKKTVRRLDLEAPTYDDSNPDYQDLIRRLNKLFGLRRRLSNQFHYCETGIVGDVARAEISINIGEVQGRIGKLLAEQRYYQRNGALPDEPITREEPLPTGIELQRKYNANCSRRGYLKKQIAKHHGTHDPNKRKSLVGWELQLKDDEREFEKLKAAIARETL